MISDRYCGAHRIMTTPTAELIADSFRDEVLIAAAHYWGLYGVQSGLILAAAGNGPVC